MQDLVGEIAVLAHKHHELYEFPIKAELWENILAKSFTACGLATDWAPDGNHTQGVDMTIMETGERVSCKSGALSKNRQGQDQCVISGSRTTRYKTLKEKLEYFAKPKDDVYFLLARDREEWSSDKKYYIIAFPSMMLNYSEHDWFDTFSKRMGSSKHNGYCMSSDVFDAKVVFSMSDQLWTTIKDYKDNEQILIQPIEVG